MPERVDLAGRAGHRVDRPAARGLDVGDGAGDLPGVRVDEDLRRVGPRALPRPVRPVHPVAVTLPGDDSRNVPVPDSERALGECDATFGQLAGPGRRPGTPRRPPRWPRRPRSGPRRGRHGHPTGRPTRSARIGPVAAHGSPSEALFPTRSEPPVSDTGDFVIRMEGVSVRRGDTTLLESVDWTVELDERWVVLGPERRGQDDAAAAGRRRHPPVAGRRRGPRRAARPGGRVRAAHADRPVVGGAGAAGAARRGRPRRRDQRRVRGDRPLAGALRPARRRPRGRAARRAGAARAGRAAPTGRCRRASGSGR